MLPSAVLPVTISRGVASLALWLTLAALSFGPPTPARAAGAVVIEDWASHQVGAKGLPAGWTQQQWGHPRYDFTITAEDGRKVVHLRSAGDSSTANKEIKGRVDLKTTPVLEWTWKVAVLPQGADARHKDTDDQAAQLYVTWPRFPETVRSRVIGYIWDATAPTGTIVKSQKTGTVTYVVVRSGPAELGRWLTERRNVREDYQRIFGEEPEAPGALSFGIDSDDVKGTAESYMGSIVFHP